MSHPRSYKIGSSKSRAEGKPAVQSREQKLSGEVADLKTRLRLLEGRLKEQTELLQAISYDANVALSQTGHECPASACLLNWSRARD